jgi:uncharacterized protein YdhG (YjbR/CyaY superfamily)
MAVMAERKSAKKHATKTAKTATKGKGSKVFTAEERAAITERAREVKAGKADGEGDALAAIAKMQGPDRAMAERLHALIKASVAGISPKTWYGMPAYAKDGNVVCFFQPAQKFKTRYATLGFSDKANLDDGNMWPAAYALKELTAAEEAKIGTLVKKAAR